jgi:hypothetical protein
MQKALDQMNLQIHRVLNDITGVSGLKILDAILAGERDPLTLARLCHGGVRNSEDTIANRSKAITAQSIYSHFASRWRPITTIRNSCWKLTRRLSFNSGTFRQRQEQRGQHQRERRLLHISGADMSQKPLIFGGNCTGSSEWI